MSAHRIGDLRDIANRRGRRARDLAGSEHGFTGMFISETEMAPNTGLPLHTHPVEEAWIVTAGNLLVRIGDETVAAGAGFVVRVPPEVPHSVRNEGPAVARALTAAPWERATFFSKATTYLEGLPRLD